MQTVIHIVIQDIVELQTKYLKQFSNKEISQIAYDALETARGKFFNDMLSRKPGLVREYLNDTNA